MKTKIIPFDLETAKKIQAGEIKGKIVTNNGYTVRIICFDKRTSSGYPILGLVDYPNQSEMCKAFNVHGLCYGQPVEYVLQIELPEEAPEEQHPIAESELYQAGYKVGFEAGRCVAFDEKKGCVIKKEALKYDDVEEVPTGDGSIVFLRHKNHEFKPFDKVLVRIKSEYTDNNAESNYWCPAIFQNYSNTDAFKDMPYHAGGRYWDECIPYAGNEYLIGTNDKPVEE